MDGSCTEVVHFTARNTSNAHIICTDLLTSTSVMPILAASASHAVFLLPGCRTSGGQATPSTLRGCQDRQALLLDIHQIHLLRFFLSLHLTLLGPSFPVFCGCPLVSSTCLCSSRSRTSFTSRIISWSRQFMDTRRLCREMQPNGGPGADVAGWPFCPLL